MYTILMIWVIKRVLILWLTLAAICATVIVIGRLNPAPDVLQTLGFDVCDGEPCYRGVKLGMDWKEAIPHWPTVGEVFDPSASYSVSIIQSDDAKVVRGIAIEARWYSPRMPISLGRIIAEYGTPYCVRIIDKEGLPGDFLLEYPGILVEVSPAIQISGNQYEYRLQPDSPILGADFLNRNDPGNCWTVYPGWSGSWDGFTSADIYYAHFHREANMPTP